jgi:hypothetical protein
VRVRGLGIRRRAADRDDRGPDRDGLTLGGEELADRAGERRGQLDERLGRLDLDEHVVDLDGVAGRDAPLDDLGLGEAFADVRQVEDLLLMSFSFRAESARHVSHRDGLRVSRCGGVSRSWGGGAGQ